MRYKAEEIAGWRKRVPLEELERQLVLAPPVKDFIGALEAHRAARGGTPGLIAEVKQASPSRGVLCPDFRPVRIAGEYEAGGASCLSVLTDAKFFQGGFEYLAAIAASDVECPLLCKEFIIERYQVVKARAHGADAILLIAAVLASAEMAALVADARALGLQCLIEVHDEAELARVLRLPSLNGCMLGINNRDLRSFKVSLEHTERIMASPAGREAARRGLLMAGESGIFTPADVARTRDAGCGAILVGESLVTQQDRAAAVRALLGL
ncbi:hypothetical protein QBZ16_000705 [Prototheca wickerhamii]|uniref:indole-3-glycerol-phosphate synthase n=1 Tax=Prototheca wickerhamii TaxID=3111 RepID=A0AAD9MPB8_PROWI|nr:hypothetical protein QBZ16_000705 [Prototheca wickerhamii]